MSLTNDMLKNLEKTSGMSQHDAVLFDGVASSIVVRRFNYLLYGLLVFFLLCVGIELFYFMNRTDRSATIPAVVSTPPTIPLMTRSIAPHPTVQPPVIVTPPSSATASPGSAPETTSLITPHIETLGTEYQMAIELLQENQEPLAIEKLEDILNRNPEYEAARLMLATLYLQHNAVDTATHTLSEGVQLNPQSINLNLLLARTLQSSGHSQEALRVLNNVSAIAGTDTVYRELLAGIDHSLGNDEKAIALYQDLLSQDSTNTRWLVGLAISLQKDHQNIEALDAYQRANASAQLSPELQDFVTKQIRVLKG